MKKIAIAILLSTFVSPPAIADLYTGIKLGRVTYGYDQATSYSRVGYGLLYGNTITKNFSVEGEYNNLGGYASATDNVAGTAYSLSAIGFYPHKPPYSFFGKMGVFSSTLTVTTKPGSGPKGSYTINNRGFMVGLGAQAEISKEIGIRGGIDIYPAWGGVPKTSALQSIYICTVLKF